MACRKGGIWIGGSAGASLHACVPGDDVLVVPVDPPLDVVKEIHQAEQQNTGERQAVATDAGTDGEEVVRLHQRQPFLHNRP